MKTLRDLARDFHNSAEEFKRKQKIAPMTIGRIGVIVQKENFTAQGFVESVGPAQKWKERSKVTNDIYDSRKGVKGSVYNSANPILLQSGNMRDNITYRTSAKGVNIGVNLNLIPYAKKNNEGGSQKFGKKWVRIPKRKFLGMSRKLALRIKDKLKQQRMEAFKKFAKL
jgi:phage gpG-like protein